MNNCVCGFECFNWNYDPLIYVAISNVQYLIRFGSLIMNFVLLFSFMRPVNEFFASLKLYAQSISLSNATENKIFTHFAVHTLYIFHYSAAQHG